MILQVHCQVGDACFNYPAGNWKSEQEAIDYWKGQYPAVIASIKQVSGHEPKWFTTKEPHE